MSESGEIDDSVRDWFDAEGAPFPRPGRATVVLVREAPGAPWKGRHTHLSEFPAERRTTFGERAP